MHLLALALMFTAADTPAQGAGATATFTPRAEAPANTDGAVPMDWAGPAARTPGADPSVQAFDPARGLFGETTMCVVAPGQPAPPCAAAATQEIRLSDDVFSSGAGNPDATCQTIEDVRLGSDGKPQRVFATVCGDEAESWNYRQRSTPGSARNPSRTTGRVLGPNDVSAPRVPEGAQPNG